MQSLSWYLLNALQCTNHENLSTFGFANQQLDSVFAALVAGDHLLAQQRLLALDLPANQDEHLNRLWLQLQIAWQLNQRCWFQSLLTALVRIAPSSDFRLKHALLQFSLWRKQILTPYGYIADQQFSDGKFPHLDLCILQSWCETNRCKDVLPKLKELRIGSCCESVLLRARCHSVNNEWEAAESLLLKNVSQYSKRWEFVEQLLSCQFILQRGETIIPTMRQLFPFYQGRERPFLDRLVQVRLLQRQPSIALRLKLLERLPTLASESVSNPDTLLPAYDMLGKPQWLRWLHSSVALRPDLYMSLHSNWLMSLSSFASDLYPTATTNLTKVMQIVVPQQLPSFDFSSHCKSINQRKLRIGWICGDIGNHPVSRFLLSWFIVASKFLQHHHVVIATYKPEPFTADKFSEIPNINYIDLSQLRDLTSQSAQIHQMNLDIAIDLNGWTGSNIAPAFFNRLAPVQVNYLAFHASTGIPSMDYWLVDHSLVAQPPLTEWHSEKLFRLTRPFIAWQPAPFQVEGRMPVSAFLASSDKSIRFGCFNNIRKISNKILKTWAALLNHVPNAKLVLKAYSEEDVASAELIRRRIKRCGLCIEQIIWLPYAASPEDHLFQYSQLDVALDSFPNTGCTTTCESLWMGVPVITLEGQHYVSRMASAVLRGANLDEWIVTSEEAYLQLAIAQAHPQRLTWLRQNREHWRKAIRQSPLGDAKDLMMNLEIAFEQMYLEYFENNQEPSILGPA